MRKHPLRVLFCAAAILTPLLATAAVDLPKSVEVDKGTVEKVCSGKNPEWRDAQKIDGVSIQESLRCEPDNPWDIVAEVKGTNNISMETLMRTSFAADSIIKKNDMDGDGDPDLIIIKLEVIELNGHSPDFNGLVPTFDIAPGIQPGMWVFAPKTRGMSTRDFASIQANPLLRAPSPVIRVEQGDVVWIQLENSHYFPHTIHLHGVDHPFVDSSGEGNDGVPQTSDKMVMPGQSKTYEIRPRVAGTFVYHCHVQTHVHLAMG
ncbi:MAG: multicopper oxidase domain-containing protein, partial [Methylococcaceae bacterium]|nr:multicopper oxidase domain-containing protein [Methylococcaceae bacterium]